MRSSCIQIYDLYCITFLDVCVSEAKSRSPPKILRQEHGSVSILGIELEQAVLTPRAAPNFGSSFP